MEDKIVTDDEMAILNILANSLGLDDDTAKFARAILNQIEKSPITSGQEDEWSNRHIGDATCYQSALIAALDDDVISDDEMAMLDCLRRAMGLQPNEHALVEESIKEMIQNQGDERLMARLESYMTSFPGV